MIIKNATIKRIETIDFFKNSFENKLLIKKHKNSIDI
jgi:hypothetical protein